MNDSVPFLGLGIGWRPELALAIDRRPGLGFVEIIAEDFADGPVPLALQQLCRRGVTVIPHGVGLSLGSAAPPEPKALEMLARLAERLQAPLVTEHLAFVRGGGIETGHLLPVPRTREVLDLVVENVRRAQAALPVPLGVENIASLVEWPDAELSEADFLCEVLERADVRLLLDVENVYANARNHGGDPLAFLDRLPLERIAYLHVAGGAESRGLYHDTHTYPVPQPVLELLEEVCARVAVPGVMLERDGSFPPETELNAELDALAAAMKRGTARREASRVAIDARARLEAQQAELVRALTGQGPAPERFDPARVEEAALSLLRKRLRAVADLWPGLGAALGERFAERFQTFARATPLPRCGAALADGRAFARQLAKTGELPDEGRWEAFAVDLRYAATADGLVRRRGVVVIIAWIQRRLVVALRCPWIGERWFTS